MCDCRPGNLKEVCCSSVFQLKFLVCDGCARLQILHVNAKALRQSMGLSFFSLEI